MNVYQKKRQNWKTMKTDVTLSVFTDEGQYRTSS